MNRYVGFYWTRPVLWAGFHRLPATLEEAARQSKTIRYQMERVRRWASEEKAPLVGEVFFLDVSPDRGTKELADALERALELCRKENAGVVHLEFHAADGWRRSIHLTSKFQEFRTATEEYGAIGLYPDPIMIDGNLFDPIQHFRDWEERERKAREKFKTNAFAELRRVSLVTPKGYGYFPDIARELNERGVRTRTGRAWTAESVRKALQRYARPLREL